MAVNEILEATDFVALELHDDNSVGMYMPRHYVALSLEEIDDLITALQYARKVVKDNETEQESTR